MYSLASSGMHTTKGRPAGTLSFHVIPAHAHLILHSVPSSKDVDRLADRTAKGGTMAFCFIITKSDSKQRHSGPCHTSVNCLYQDVHDPLPCFQIITCDDVSAHMTRTHGFKMSRNVRIDCPWNGCALTIAGHNFIRHIREVHLGHERPWWWLFMYCNLNPNTSFVGEFACANASSVLSSDPPPHSAFQVHVSQVDLQCWPLRLCDRKWVFRRAFLTHLMVALHFLEILKPS